MRAMTVATADIRRSDPLRKEATAAAEAGTDGPSSLDTPSRLKSGTCGRRSHLSRRAAAAAAGSRRAAAAGSRRTRRTRPNAPNGQLTCVPRLRRDMGGVHSVARRRRRRHDDLDRRRHRVSEQPLKCAATARGLH